MSQTIADGLQRIINAKTDIDGAIEAKDGTVTKGLENSDEDIMTIPTGATSYSPLTEKPAIDNHTLMPGNNTSSDLGLQTKLTFDSVPTENSTNPVTSGGVYTALSGKQATIDSSHKLSADNVDDTNATNKFATAAQLQQIENNKTNISWNTNNGVKNLIKLDDFSGTYIGLNVSCVNGEITISGTAGSSGSLYLTGKTHTSIDSSAYVHSKFASDNVIFTGAPTTDNKDRIIIGLMKGSTYVYSFSTQTPTQDLSQYDYDNYYIYIPLISGQQYNGTWKPMLRPAFIEDDTFEPYALPNTKITPALIECVDSGAKNCALANTLESSYGGVPCTQDANDPNIITLIGTNTSGVTMYIWGNNVSPVNKHITESYIIAPAISSTGVNFFVNYTLNGEPVTQNIGANNVIPADSTINFIYVQQTSANKSINFSVKLMVSPKSIYDISHDYIPYTLSNSELTTKEQANENNILTLERMNGAKNLAPYNSGEHIGNASYWFLHTNCIDIAAGTSVYLVYDYTQTAGQYSLQLTDENGQIISGTASYTTDGATSGHRATKVTIPTGKTAKGYNAYHNTNATVTISNFMIVPAEIYEAGFTDYQPYALPNTKITPELIELVDSGAKNELNVTATSSGICTVNSDGSITVNGAVGDTDIQFVVRQFTAAEGVKLRGKILSGCPSGGGSSIYGLYLQQNQSPWATYGYTIGDYGSTISNSIGTTGSYLLLVLRKNQTISNVTFKPMICTKAAWDVSQKFVPYRPSYIGASDYATQNTGGTVRVWTTTSGGETTLHISNEAP